MPNIQINMNRYPTLSLVLLFCATSAVSHVSAYTFTKEQVARYFPEQIRSEQEAMRACKPGKHLAMYCEHCQNLTMKDGKDKKGVLSWFTPGRKHDCSLCGGAVTLKKQGATDPGNSDRFAHACSKCGDRSASICAGATRKKSKTTKG